MRSTAGRNRCQAAEFSWAFCSRGMAVATSIATPSDWREGCSFSQLAMAPRPRPRRLRSVWPISPVRLAQARA